MSDDFVHWHSHTIFSALDGVASPEQYATLCTERGWKTMCATEHGHLASVPDMYLSAKSHGLKYVPGCEIYFNQYEPLRKEIVANGQKIADLKHETAAAPKEGLHAETEHGSGTIIRVADDIVGVKLDSSGQVVTVAASSAKCKKPADEVLHSRIMRNRHLTVIAQNQQGLYNLTKLTTLAHKFGFYYRPRIWLEKLCEHKEGLIVLSGCLNGPLAHELRLDFEHKASGGCKRVPGRDLTALQYARLLKAEFGDRFYVEVQMPCLPEIYDHQVFSVLFGIAELVGAKTILTNDSHYVTQEGFFLQKVMMAIDQKVTVDDPGLFHVNSSEQYYKTRAELLATFRTNSYSRLVNEGAFNAACDSTLELAERCDPLKPDTNPKTPDWSSIEPGKSADVILREIVGRELVRRGLHKDAKRWPVDGKEVTYTEQAKIELDRFIEKGFASYFLITYDLMRWGKQRGWPFGSRGSAGGSLVCYLLSISALDPLRWGLSFDRFMASSRGGYLLQVKM